MACRSASRFARSDSFACCWNNWSISGYDPAANWPPPEPRPNADGSQIVHDRFTNAREDRVARVVASIEPGRYECQVTVLDPETGKAAFWRQPLAVVP